MATLSLKNINKVYPNNVQAVFDFNLEIKDKEFIVFVGPSGCGKSTTLRMIAGLEDITSGEFYIDGQLMNNVVPKDRNIAMVFQSYALYPHMTVYDNMKFALKLRKIPKPLYKPNDEVLPLEEENKEIRKQIAKINRQFKKRQDASELLEDRAALYKNLYANQKTIDEALVQEVGIDLYGIKETKKLISRLNKDIAKTEKLTAKYGGQDENTDKVLAESLEQKQKQLAEAEEKLQYLENNEVPLYKVRHLTNAEMDIEINKVAESIDLIRYLFRKPAALSGGQRQRVALGRAIVRKPKVFLMDEPLSNLDAKLRVQTRSEISKIHERVGATTVYVTHDQTEAMTMADRIVVMKDGWIQQIGTPEEVYDNPANKFVAGFIGSPAMNFINGHYSKGVFHANTATSTEGDVTIGVEKFEYKVSEKAAKLLEDYEGKDIILGVRPESVYLKGDKNNANPSAPIECTCDYSELLGYELVLYTYICGQKLILKTGTSAKVASGDAIEMCFDDNALYFFDSATEQRIK